MLKLKMLQFYSNPYIAEKVAKQFDALAVQVDGLWAIRRGDHQQGFEWLMLNGLFKECKIGISR